MVYHPTLQPRFRNQYVIDSDLVISKLDQDFDILIIRFNSRKLVRLGYLITVSSRILSSIKPASYNDGSQGESFHMEQDCRKILNKIKVLKVCR